MNTPKISFGSLMVFTLEDDKPKLEIPEYMRISFSNKDALKKYSLKKDVFVYDKEKIDGTVYNANKNFSKFLNKFYKDILPKGSSNVILTEAEFLVGPEKTTNRFFLTAASGEDEAYIHKILSESEEFYVAKF